MSAALGASIAPGCFVLLTLSAAPSLAAPAPSSSSGAAAPAAADPMAEAQEAFQLGTQAYALGNYDQAVTLFERSYALSGRPELLFNLGQAYAQWYSLSDDVGHLRKARKLYENYIKFLEASDGVDPEAIADTRDRITEIDALIAAREPEPEPEPEPEGPAEPPRIEPGPPTQAPVDDAPPKRPIYRKGWFWGVVIGAAAVVATGVALGVVAHNNRTLDPELGTLRGAALRTAPALPPGLRF